METILDLLSTGDRALARGNARALATIARKLSRRLGDPLNDRLLALSLVCGHHIELAAAEWPQLRQQIEQRVEIAGT